MMGFVLKLVLKRAHRLANPRRNVEQFAYSDLMQRECVDDAGDSRFFEGKKPMSARAL